MNAVRMFGRVRPPQEITEGPLMSVEGVKAVVMQWIQHGLWNSNGRKPSFGVPLGCLPQRLWGLF
jgi:hypothetical protein